MKKVLVQRISARISVILSAAAVHYLMLQKYRHCQFFQVVCWFPSRLLPVANYTACWQRQTVWERFLYNTNKGMSNTLLPCHPTSNTVYKMVVYAVKQLSCLILLFLTWQYPSELQFDTLDTFHLVPSLKAVNIWITMQWSSCRPLLLTYTVYILE